MEANEGVRVQARAAAKSLRWLEQNFAGADGSDEANKLCRCIHVYAGAGADSINALNVLTGLLLKRISGLKAQLAVSQREKQTAVECIRGIEEAIKFQRYSAAELRILEWRGQQEPGK